MGTDTNIDPDTSDVLKLATENGLLKDLPKDWHPDRKPPATFLREGVYEGMMGVGTSRIDTVLTNFTGGHACKLFKYHWQQSFGFDHVALLLIVDLIRFDEEVETITKPQSLLLPEKITGAEKSCRKPGSTSSSRSFGHSTKRAPIRLSLYATWTRYTEYGALPARPSC